MLTGVPGSGKTLVGLRAVYEGSTAARPATFLSGNRPLVKVLQSVLNSKAFVRDLHNFIKTYGLQGKTPVEHVIVFDEAQRAWDQPYMEKMRGIAKSEPELLLEVGDKLEGWAVLLGLVGEGQEIFCGEEAGIAQWSEAVRQSEGSWKVHASGDVADLFSGLPTISHAELDLTVSLRSHQAKDAHEWVRLVIEGSPALAARVATAIHDSGFEMYLTRELDQAKDYVKVRYEDEPEKRYGLIAPSATKKSFLLNYEIKNHFLEERKVKVDRWYTAPPDDPMSSNALIEAITEFSCQGLELDFPIICWNDDKLWNGTSWDRRHVPRQHGLIDPVQIQKNVYRVLLTRGRDGIIIFIPPVPDFDLTEQILLASGVKPLPKPRPLVADVPKARSAPLG